MEMSEIARTMGARMPWPVARRILREEGLPRGHGWEKTIATLSNGQDYLAKVDDAAAALIEHHLCGEKLVRIYCVPPGVKSAIEGTIGDIKPPDSVFKAVYPAYVEPDALADAPSTPTLVAIETTDYGKGFVFASVRIVTTRELLESDDLQDGVFEEYDEIYGLKRARYQAMDVVWVPASGNYIDIRIDYPRGMQRDVGGAAQALVKSEFHKLIGSTPLGLPSNLFPLIDKIYRMPAEGKVVELAFGTTTASNKHEKMRRKALCLREEIYHIGGLAALTTPIEPYRLSVVWKIALQNKTFSAPELSLNSSSIVSADANPTMMDAVIRNCMGYADFDHVKSRMEHFLSVE